MLAERCQRPRIQFFGQSKDQSVGKGWKREHGVVCRRTICDACVSSNVRDDHECSISICTLAGLYAVRYQKGRGCVVPMSKVLSAAKWSFDLLAKRIAALRSKKIFHPSRIYSSLAYDESQMRDSDVLRRQQKSELEYDC